MVSGSRSIQRLGDSNMTHPVFATGRIMEPDMWNRWPVMCVSDLEMVGYATRRVAKAFADAQHWQMIEKYWNTTMQQNNIWSIALDARTNEILQEVCWSNGPCRILQSRTGTRFKHKSTKLNHIPFIPHGTILQSNMVSTALNSTLSVWNSLIPFWQTISIFFLWQSVWKVVYAFQIQCRECRKLPMNGQRPLCFLAEAIPGFIQIKFYHRENNRGKYADGFYNSMIDNKDSHIP